MGFVASHVLRGDGDGGGVAGAQARQLFCAEVVGPVATRIHNGLHAVRFTELDGDGGARLGRAVDELRANEVDAGAVGLGGVDGDRQHGAGGAHVVAGVAKAVADVVLAVGQRGGGREGVQHGVVDGCHECAAHQEFDFAHSCGQGGHGEGGGGVSGDVVAGAAPGVAGGVQVGRAHRGGRRGLVGDVQRDGFLSAVARAVGDDDGKAVVGLGGSVCIVHQGDDTGDGVDGEARAVGHARLEAVAQVAFAHVLGVRGRHRVDRLVGA